ncbi:MAG TPA: hypothetical protein VKX33_08715 [Cyclobacteriaceae bacterium]|nr:hypothetical protein [Cyclobacteriaceae bacterium]
MKNLLTILLAGYLTSFLYLEATAQGNRPAHIGFVYPISTNGVEAASYTNNFSVHAIAGVSGGETGLALYGIGGIIKGDAKGVIASGVWSNVDGAIEGVQMSGIFNTAGNASKGTQFAGVLNSTDGNTPVQMAGVLNKAVEVTAIQASGVANLSKTLDGVQISGVTNFSGKVKGSQIAGVVNVADGVEGFQLAGVVNKAKTVKGVQLAGLLNIADSSDYPIALINLIKDGERRIGISTDEALNTVVSFRSGGRKLYGILGLGTNLNYSPRQYGFESGFGLKLVDNRPFRLDVEALNVFLTDFHGLEYNKSGIRLLPSLALSDNIQLYAGPSVNYTVHNMDDADLVKLPLWEKNPRDLHKSIHLGYTFGVQVKL